MTASTLFRMGDLPISLAHPCKGFDDLPTVSPDQRFHLPRLDELAAGSERLMEGLESLRVGSRTPTDKGKEKEAAPPVVMGETLRASDLWERIAEGQAGPSTGPTLRVGARRMAEC